MVVEQTLSFQSYYFQIYNTVLNTHSYALDFTNKMSNCATQITELSWTGNCQDEIVLYHVLNRLLFADPYFFQNSKYPFIPAISSDVFLFFVRVSEHVRNSHHMWYEPQCFLSFSNLCSTLEIYNQYICTIIKI